MGGIIDSPIYLVKPTTEVWRSDCKGECNRIICHPRWARCLSVMVRP